VIIIRQESNNPNRPKPGSCIKVEPIKRKQDISTIKKMLANRPRDLVLFTLGINTNLRASDLLRIRVKDVRGMKPGDEIEIKEKKTGKIRRITLNRVVIATIDRLLKAESYEDNDFLFKSQRAPVLTVQSVHRLVKGWCKAIHIKGNYGSHTMRKTWGYQQRVTFGVGLPELMVAFNHSSQKQTLDYLCIQPEELKCIYENEI
jgi:integrase